MNNNIINLGEIGEDSKSNASLVNTNYLFSQGLLRYDLKTKEFCWDNVVNVSDFSNN